MTEAITPVEGDLLARIAAAGAALLFDNGSTFSYAHLHAGEPISVPILRSLAANGMIHGGPTDHEPHRTTYTVDAPGLRHLIDHPVATAPDPRDAAALLIVGRAATETISYWPATPATAERKRVAAEAITMGGKKVPMRPIQRALARQWLTVDSHGNLSATTDGINELGQHQTLSDTVEAARRARSEHRIVSSLRALGGRAWGRSSTRYGGQVSCTCGWTATSNESRTPAEELGVTHVAEMTDEILLEIQRARLAD